MAAGRYAIVSSGKVTNIILWDGSDGWSPAEGETAIVLDDASIAGMGSTYADGTFSAPAVIEPS